MGQAENTRLRNVGLDGHSEASWRTCFGHWTSSTFFPPQTQCCELTPGSYRVTYSFSGPNKRQKKKRKPGNLFEKGRTNLSPI